MTPDPSDTSSRGVVSIHGAGLDTWIWDEITPSFANPHLPVSFPARNGRNTHPPGLGLDDYVDHVCQQIVDWPPTEIIIVAHSIGGVIGKEVVAALPERVIGFVGVCAAVPNPGRSFLSSYPIHQRLLQRVVMRMAGTKPPDAMIRASLCNGLSDARANRVVEEFHPESRKLFTDPSHADIPEVRSLYVETLGDNEFSPGLQARMIDNLQPDRVATIDAGHLPMLSDPDELAGVVNAFTEE